eukprot:11430292-Ditylum_brightwellii.AAC.1
MMLDNFFTKLLQCKAFRTIGNMLMNVDLLLPREVLLKLKQKTSLSAKTPLASSGISLQESVGDNKNES